MKVKVIQVCGTGSGVGKSVIVAGLCRIFLQDGFKVAPFKAQNMALNSFVTKEGGEIGRAQAVQAQASRIEATVDMNPILIKPTSDVGAQIVLHGKAIGNMDALEYTHYKKQLVGTVFESFNRLKERNEVIVIEGAGSPAEINLKEHDIVNMKMAEFADSPVVLVGDIDKGGVFAWLWGTMDLLTEKEKQRIKGLIINKFRGDKSLLMPGVEFLEKNTHKKILWIIPYFRDIKIPEEDSLAEHKDINFKEAAIKIEIIYLPHISNFTDFDGFREESDVSMAFVKRGEAIDPDCDVVIIPGSKNTISDFRFLKDSGYVEQLARLKEKGKEIVGICGGFQMLGRKILDPLGIESNSGESEALGFLNVVTTLQERKATFQVKAVELTLGMELAGYEIHHGKTEFLDSLAPIFEIVEQGGREVKISDGAKNPEGNVWGTYLHGIFDNNQFRRAFLNQIRRDKGLAPLDSKDEGFNQDKEFDNLAQLLRENIDMDYLYRILRKEV